MAADESRKRKEEFKRGDRVYWYWQTGTKEPGIIIATVLRVNRVSVTVQVDGEDVPFRFTGMLRKWEGDAP